MAKKYRLSKDEQSQLHDIMPSFTFVVVEFVFIEEKFQAFRASTQVFNLHTINPALQQAIIVIPVKLALKCYLL
jgi:hypothetical protein